MKFENRFALNKRYEIKAKRLNDEKWSDWSCSDDIESAIMQANKIKSHGWIFKIFDKVKNEVVTID